MEYGKQIGVIVYGGGINVRCYAAEAIRNGYIVVHRDGYATIHEHSQSQRAHND